MQTPHRKAPTGSWTWNPLTVRRRRYFLFNDDKYFVEETDLPAVCTAFLYHSLYQYHMTETCSEENTQKLISNGDWANTDFINVTLERMSILEPRAQGWWNTHICAHLFITTYHAIWTSKIPTPFFTYKTYAVIYRLHCLVFSFILAWGYVSCPSLRYLVLSFICSHTFH